MCGPTGCTSTSGSPRSGGAPFTSSGCAPTGPRSWSRSPTGWAGSTESWAELLGDLRRRGMQAPVLAVGDGALGLWAALRDVFPATRTQRCWVHRSWKEIMCRSPCLGLLVWYAPHAHPDGGPWSTRHQVRGVVAAPQRAPAALGVGGRGAAA